MDQASETFLSPIMNTSALSGSNLPEIQSPVGKTKNLQLIHLKVSDPA
jgi:hypothetical protein